jgi:hypothetical protein
VEDADGAEVVGGEQMYPYEFHKHIQTFGRTGGIGVLILPHQCADLRI